MVHSYYDALTVIALFRVVNSKTLTLLFQDHTLRSHFIQKALSKKHVRKATVQERVNGERKSLTLFSITWKGLNYIAQKDSGLYELLLHQPNISIFNTMENKASVRTKLAAMSNTAVIAHSAGANIPSSTFSSIQNDAVEKDEEEESQASETIRSDAIIWTRNPCSLQMFLKTNIQHLMMITWSFMREAPLNRCCRKNRSAGIKRTFNPGDIPESWNRILKR